MQRHLNYHGCAFALGPGDLYLSSNQKSAFTDSEQPQRFGIGYFPWCNPAAVVAHRQLHVGALELQTYFDSRSLRVSGHIGQSLLQDAE